jgi:ankyrin repeat protein
VRNKLLRLLGLRASAPAGKVRAALNEQNWDGNLPIHHALDDTATGPELVRAMLEAGGDAMLAVLALYKELPLHIAAHNSPFPTVVGLLLARGPAGALRAETAGENTPLRCAERYNKGQGAAEIAALLHAAMR